MNVAHNSWPVPDANRTPQEWGYPNNLGPVSAATHARGQNRTNNEAEEILASAIAYWDVSKYRDGDRFLRNQGTGGSVLDLRLGSSLEPNTNDPKYLAPEDTGYVYLPGVASNYLSVPNAANLNIAGDIDIRARVALDSWTPSALSALMAKYDSTGGNQSWYWAVNTNGTLILVWITSGAVTRSATSTAAPTIGAGLPLWVRATLTVNNGAGTPQYEVRFYTSDDGSTWNQLGSTVTGSTGVTDITSSSIALEMGTRSAGGSSPMSGKIYRAQVLNGINGTTVLDVDCDAITSGAVTSFVASTGQTVTINRATSGRKTVAMPSKTKDGRPLMLLGTDDYMECTDAAQHGLLNFRQGDSFTVLAAFRAFNQPSSNAFPIVCKGGSPSYVAQVGWGIFQSSGSRVRSYVLGANAVSANLQVGGAPSGLLYVIYAAIARDSAILAVGVAASRSTTTTAGVGSLVNALALRIGTHASTTGAPYADMEFRAAAIFRRELTAREISVINNAAPWGV